MGRKPISPDRENAMRRCCHLRILYPHLAKLIGEDRARRLAVWEQPCCTCEHPADCMFVEELPEAQQIKINSSLFVIPIR